MQSVQEYSHPTAHLSHDYYAQNFQYPHAQDAEQQICGHDDETFPIPVISHQRDIITSHDQPPPEPICGHDDQTFPIPVVSQRVNMFAPQDQPREQQICGHDANTSVGKNQSCDLSNTDGYGENFSDCDADVESSGGESLKVTVPFAQENVMGPQPLTDTANLRNAGPPGTNENILKRKNENTSSNYELRSQKKSKVEESTQAGDSYQVMNLSTQFQEDVMNLLRERCEWLGLNEEVYNNMSGMSLLTIIVMRESELTKFENLTDMQVIALLEGQREKLRTKSKCPYCMRKFESKGTAKGQQKESDLSDKEIRMSYTDQMISLVTSKPGKSRVFPDEMNDEPKTDVVDTPRKKKKLISRKKRKSVKKISDKSSDEIEDAQKSVIKYSKEDLKDYVTRPVEVSSLVEEICTMPVPETKDLVQEDQVSPLRAPDGKPGVSTSVKENIDLSRKHGTSVVTEEEVSPFILGTDGKPLLNFERIKKRKTLLNETPKETKTQPVVSTSTGITKEGVLVLTQHGKAVLNLGRVKIGKNIKLESSKVATIPEKERKQESSGECIDRNAPKQNPCVASQSAKKTPYVTRTVHSTKAKKQGSKGDEQAKLQSFEKAFGAAALASQLGTKNVLDTHDFNLEKDKESLATLRTLIKSHFVRKNEQDYDNLKMELSNVSLESYFPGGIVVKEGYDIFEIIVEALPSNNVVELRSTLCKYLSSNLDYFGKLFAEEFEGKDLNIFDYIGKLIRNTTVPDHNAIFGLSKMLKQSFFIVGVRHNWKSAHTPNIDIVMAYVGNKKFYPVTLHKAFKYKKPV